MGCNESKHNAVATANTVLRRKQSDKSTKDIETVKENPTAEITSTVDHDRDHHHAKDVVGHENGVASTVIAEKNLDHKKESEKEDQQLVDQGDNHDHCVQRLIGRESPNHFFSSRKDEEIGSRIDGIISEGRSGKSEYNTPRLKDDDDDHHDQDVKADDRNNVVKVDDDNHDHMEADHVQNIDQKKELADDENQDQSRAAEENDKSRNLEENAVLNEEPPVSTTAESEISSTVEKEKSTASTTEEEQHVVDSPTEESKTM